MNSFVTKVVSSKGLEVSTWTAFG